METQHSDHIGQVRDAALARRDIIRAAEDLLIQLDEAQLSVAAAHVQLALDVLRGAASMRPYN